MPLYVFLEPEIIKILAEMATDRHMSMSDLVAVAVVEYLKEICNTDDRSKCNDC